MEQHERENNSPGISNSRSPNVAVPKASIHRGPQVNFIIFIIIIKSHTLNNIN